jgi:hypothetical protein
MVANCVDRVVLHDVEVVEHGEDTVRCRIGAAVVSIPPLRMLPGSTVSYPGDRGRLVLPREVAVQFKLV